MATWTRLALLTTLLAGACSPATLKADGGADDDGATVDATGTDAGPGTLTVIVLDNAAFPQPDAKVAFFERSGDLIAMVLTDANGTASMEVFPDAMVAVGRAGNEMRIEVVAGAQPGETIEFGPPVGERSGTQLGTASVRLPVGFAGATRYLAGSCFLNQQGIGTAFTHFFQDDDCTRGATTQDLLAIALDDAGIALAYATIPGVLVNSPTTFDAGTWNTDFRRPSLTLLDAPFDGTVDLNVKLYRNDVEYRYDGSSTPIGAIALDQNASVDLIFPPNFADKVNVELSARSSLADRLVLWASNLAPTIGAQTVDLTAGMLPPVDQTAYDTADPARPEWRYRINGDATEGTAQLHATFISDPDIGAFYIVVVAAPPDHPAPFRMPALPADIITNPTDPSQPAWPPSLSATVVQYFSGLYHATYVPSYQAFRTNRGLGSIFADQMVSRDVAVGGTARISVGGLLAN